MIVQFKNRILQFGGSISFIVSGTSFPQSSIGFQSATNAGGSIFKNFSITINYNDGTEPVVYNSTTTGVRNATIYNVGNSNINPATGNYGGKVFADGNKTDRVVTITCSDWSALTLISINAQLLSRPQNLAVPFRLATNLVSFVSPNGLASGNNSAFILEIDQALFKLPYLRTLQLGGNSFYIDSRYYGNLQSALLNPQLTSLTLGGMGYTGKSFADNNLKALSSTNMPNLTTFNTNAGLLGGSGDNGFGEGPFPIEWTTLPLINFSVSAASWSTIPDRINQMSPTLQIFSPNTMSTLVSWGTDLSNLINLNTLNFINCPFFPNNVPSYLSALTKLKTLDYRSCFQVASRPQSDMDTLITNWYNFVITNAPIIGTSSDQFRSMTFNIQSSVAGNPTNVWIPSGTYQQPTGYIQGSNNGTPTSSLERIWVLVNQYSHTWNYRTS